MPTSNIAMLLSDYKGLRADPKELEDVRPEPASRVLLGFRVLVESSELLVRSFADKLKGSISVDEENSRWGTLPLRLRASTR
jgi:hypothetical protein